MKMILDTKVLECNIKKYSECGKIYYPLKTNSDAKLLLEMIKISKALKIKIKYLVSNQKHIKILQKLNVSMNDVTWINTIEPLKTLVKAYNSGVRSFVIDNSEILKELLLITNGDVEITVKLSVTALADIAVNTGTDRIEQEKIEEILLKNNCAYGYSIYINEKAKKKADMLEYVNYILKSKNIRCAKFISIGGLDDVTNINYSNKLQCANRKAMYNELQFRIEPGFHLVNNVIHYVMRIKKLHNSDGVESITIEDTIYNKFFDAIAIGRKFDFYEIVQGKEKFEIQNIEQDKNRYKCLHVFGDSSDSLDYIASIWVLLVYKPKISDEIVIKNVGAYFKK